MIKKLRGPGHIDEDFKFPSKVYDLVFLVLNKGYSLTLVGGCVRDYLLNKTMGVDFDFELGHNQNISSWEAHIDELACDLERQTSFRVSRLPFSIIKLESDEYCVELASIRTETYKEQSVYGHCDFDCKISPLLNFKQAAVRRDLTINALGLELKIKNKVLTFHFHDPFNGHLHLKKGIIKNIDGDFFKDPVRFLRAIRFSLQLGMEFDSNLDKQFHQFNLMSLSNHYFFSEAMKGDFFHFSRIFFSLVKTHNIPIPDSLARLVFLQDSVLTSFYPRNPKEILLALIFSSVDEESLMNFIQYAGLDKTLLVRYQSYKKNLIDLSSISLVLLMKKLKNQTPQEIIFDKELEVCSVFFSLFKNDHEALERILPPSVFEIYRIWRIHIPEKLKGKKLFLNLKKTINIPKKQMALLRLYAHFMEEIPNSFIQE